MPSSPFDRAHLFAHRVLWCPLAQGPAVAQESSGSIHGAWFLFSIQPGKCGSVKTSGGVRSGPPALHRWGNGGTGEGGWRGVRCSSKSLLTKQFSPATFVHASCITQGLGLCHGPLAQRVGVVRIRARDPLGAWCWSPTQEALCLCLSLFGLQDKIPCAGGSRMADVWSSQARGWTSRSRHQQIRSRGGCFLVLEGNFRPACVCFQVDGAGSCQSTHPIHRGPPSRPHHLPNAAPPNTLMGRAKISTYAFGVGNTFDPLTPSCA